MITDGECSFVTYLYADGLIQWTTGDVSGGSGGLGGIRAQAGFDAGDGMRSFSHPDSQTAAIINIDTTTNIGIPGQWTFRVDREEIVQPWPSSYVICTTCSYCSLTFCLPQLRGSSCTCVDLTRTLLSGCPKELSSATPSRVGTTQPSISLATMTFR